MANLTLSQETTIVTALRGETNPDVVAALSIGNVTFLTAWCNSPSTTMAWASDIIGRALFGAMDITLFDNLTAGKRQAFQLMIEYSPLDFAKNENRKAIKDIWGDVNGAPILTACLRPATKAENYIGGTVATTSGVSGTKLTFSGLLTIDDIGQAINRNP